ncbi:MAG: hypothetical protein IPK20_16295 [Betaproteobacteria bacterium]|nr:hypothetical protein [Betaproteobacteria bacterium]
MARKHLAEGLARGRRLGAMNTYVWLPWMMSELASAALEQGIETDYVQRLIRMRKLRPPENRPSHWPWPVRIRCLGTFEIEIEGSRLQFAGKSPKRPLELLKGVIARGGRSVDCQRLWESLWPDADGDAAADAFSMALHRLRKLLCVEHTVLLEEGRISLNEDVCWIDAEAFDRLSETALRYPGGSNAAHEALGLYRGHFLDNEPAQPLMLPARDRHRSRMQRLVEREYQALAQRAKLAGSRRYHGPHWKSIPSTSLLSRLDVRAAGSGPAR